MQCPHCGAEVEITDLPIGLSIACASCGNVVNVTRYFQHYRLDNQLGEGGMGTVYAAMDTILNRIVAIKVLRPELSDDSKFMQTFKREMEITASLTHPNIVQVFTGDTHEGRAYLVMELISNRTMDDIIVEQKKIPEIAVLDIGIGIATGLEFALLKGGLVHRDIKPGNMMFGPNNIPKVVDFGLALTAETANDVDDEVWGTPYYVPPERLEGVPEDFRSDMYALGMSLYHAISGRPPFEGETAEVVASKHLTERPIKLKTYQPYLAEQTVYAIERAIARFPDQRFSSYREMIEVMQDAKRRIQGGQIAPKVYSREITNTDEKKTAYIIIGIIAVIILIGFSLFAYFRSNPQEYQRWFGS